MNIQITAKNISYCFRFQTILNNISFNRSEKGITVILGENGVGKSVFLRLLAGIYRPSKGHIFFNCLESKQSLQPENYQTRNYIGYQNEDFAFWKEYCIQDIIQLTAYIKGINDSDIHNKVMEEFHLDHMKHQTLKTLSLGYQKRLSLALSTLGNPEILLLDEPTNGLDPCEKDFFSQWITKFAHNHFVFLSSHYLEELEKLDSNIQVLLLVKTHLQYDGPLPSNLGRWYRKQHEKLS